MNKKIVEFLKRLYNELNGDYIAEKEELKKIQCSIKAFESCELSAMEQASYLAAQDMERGCSAYCKRIKNALDSIELLIQPQASVPGIAENLLRQYYAACKEAAKNEGRTDMDNILSVQISRIESQLREVGYAIFGGLSTFKKIEKEKAERKLKKAEAKLKKAQRKLEKTDHAAEEDHADEMNCVGSTPQKDVGSKVQTGDAMENKADPTAQTRDTTTDAKEDAADPTAQTEGTPANSNDAEEDPNEDVVLHIRVIFI